MKLSRVVWLVLAAWMANPVLGQTASGREVAVIVHPDNPQTSLDRATISGLFLKKVALWPEGAPAEPVDHGDPSVRERFSQQVHSRSQEAISAFWRAKLFAGLETPPQQLTEAEVLEWVRTRPGGVGYLKGTAPQDGVRVLRITD